MRWLRGSSGLIGSEAAAFFDERGYDVHGVDNNMRREFFGADGDTTWNLERLRASHDAASPSRPRHPDARGDADLFATHRPIADRPLRGPAVPRSRRATSVRRLRGERRRHAQPARGRAPALPRAPVRLPRARTRSTATRRTSCRSSSSRPAGTTPTRPTTTASTRTAASTRRSHSLFGASKAAADVLVQEYGRYFGMPTVCFRGGCLTGPHHSGVELHGFLAYLARAVREGRPYRIFGYKGKQVRDNIHSYDVCTAIRPSTRIPRPGAVYNLGGGRENSVSMLEAIDALRGALGPAARVGVRRREPRRGDHICYISRPPPLPGRLSGLEPLAVARGHLRGLCPRAAATPRRIGQPVPASA